MRFGLIASLALVGTSAASAVIDLIPKNFDDIVLKSGKPALVEFFAPWCGHCKTLAPVYEELASSFEFAKDKVTIAKVDADAHKELGRRFGVQGFPTLKWFDGKSDTPQDYNSGRDLESLSAFISEKTGLKQKKKAATPSNVEMLNDQTFKTEIGGDKDVIVAFTAPWCGRKQRMPLSEQGKYADFFSDCKTLAPIWEKLANTYANEPNVLIAKVDAEAENAKSTAQSQGIKGYPTIKFFPKGSKEPVAYEGGRSEDALVKYLNEKAGTHRTVGGGLDITAGTIAALDSFVSQYTSGGALETIQKEILAASENIKDTYAQYYVKVFDKLAQNPGYVEKESKRLNSLLKKGGLAPAKVDDLTKRSNILSKFVAKVQSVKEEL
ncbi:protein disulfide-isomerase tigA precursor [Aureobasidium sp. EXF-10727]|nr:protein disulfide-isomerase tigA precursor [Aureobasidium sp. EXF-10727]KAI4725760.1 protein disulfide-isomerase tigA precursor [Aureobasidium sp. EXF-10728]